MIESVPFAQLQVLDMPYENETFSLVFPDNFMLQKYLYNDYLLFNKFQGILIGILISLEVLGK